MRIAIINLTGGGISGGYRNYLLKLMPGLCLNEKVSAVLCASPESLQCETWLPADPKIKYINCEPFKPLRHKPSAGLKAALDAFKPDVVFVPVERCLKYAGAPVVCMIQNMAPLTPHGDYGLWERFRMTVQRYEARAAVNNAAHVIAISNFVRDFLIKSWGGPTEKASLVYFGATDHLEDSVKPAMVPESWAGSYFFSSGSLEPYRGLEDLISAAGLLRKSGRNIKLVIAGGSRPAVSNYKERLLTLAASVGISESIIWLGHISREEINWCYKNCSAFVMTSRVEALAVIALEALTHKCICLSVANPPLPEVFGESADYYTPGDSSALAALLEQVLRADTAWRDLRRSKADAAISRFSWEATVSKTVEVLESVANTRR